MSRAAQIILSSALAAALNGGLHAQTQWNRNVEAIAITPAPVAGGGGGVFNIITAYINVESDSPSAPRNLDTVIEFRRNGVTLGAVEIGFDALPASNSNCGAMCLSNQACICCQISPGNTIYACGGFIAPASTGASLDPGDEITVILIPASGALPDQDTSDDQLSIAYPGDPLFWNRRLAGISTSPTPGAGDSFFDVFFDIAVEANYDGPLNLATEAVLLVNGVAVAEQDVPLLIDDLLFTPCNAACTLTGCVLNPVGPYFGTCQPDEGTFPCTCQYQPVPSTGLVFPAVPVDPGDEITVILRPAPGALPELPGFPDDDEGTVRVPQPCVGDADGNGIVDVGDLLAVILDWGTDGSGNGGDVNNDGEVNVLDIVAVINNWGVCFPV